jgi:hypothetical protein
MYVRYFYISHAQDNLTCNSNKVPRYVFSVNEPKPGFISVEVLSDTVEGTLLFIVLHS